MANGPGQWGDRGRPSREDLYQRFGSSITIPLRTNPISAPPDPAEGFQVNKFLDELKLHLIQRAMELAGGVQSRAARLLGISLQAIKQFLKGRNLS